MACLLEVKEEDKVKIEERMDLEEEKDKDKLINSKIDEEL